MIRSCVLSLPSDKPKGSFIRRQIETEKQRLKDAVALFTKPGRGDRLVQFIYTQLPYTPERIERATSWTVELAQPLDVTLQNRQPANDNDPVIHKESTQTATAEKRQVDILRIRIQSGDCAPICSKPSALPKRSRGNTFQALVAEPVFNTNHVLEVPGRFPANWGNHAGKAGSFFWTAGKAPVSLSGIEVSQAASLSRSKAPLLESIQTVCRTCRSTPKAACSENHRTG